MKSRTVITMCALIGLTLTGCASQAQIDEQNNQLLAINASLMQIRAYQAESLAQQKVQTSVLVETHNLQAAEAEQQLKRK